MIFKTLPQISHLCFLKFHKFFIREEGWISELSEIRSYSDHFGDRKSMPQIRILEYTIFRAFFHDFYVVAWARIIFLLELSFTIVVLPSFNYFRQKLMAFLKSKFRELQNELPHDYIKALNFHRIHSLSNKKHKFGYSDLGHWYSVTQNGPNKSEFRIIRISGLQL